MSYDLLLLEQQRPIKEEISDQRKYGKQAS